MASNCIRTILQIGIICFPVIAHPQSEPADLPAGSQSTAIQNLIAAREEGKFLGWPANNGLWSWDNGKEILVGFSCGKFVEQEGHNIEGLSDDALGIETHLCRSLDGGHTWSVENPDHFVGDGGEVTPSPGGIEFDNPGFALRVIGVGYHGTSDPEGGFFYSYTRGKSWNGPYRFGALMDNPNLEGMECTSRTGYLVTGKQSCLVFMSARPKENGAGRDKSFVAETTDGGKSFQFISWIVPLDDPNRAVMPAVVMTGDGTIVVALRRRIIGQDVCWVDCYSSSDKGRTWSFLSRVGETGSHNGNPPALALLKDGRLACAYGDRSRVRMFVRMSSDHGHSWGDELVLREDFQPDSFGDKDFGYPRLVQNHEGEMLALYYWANSEHPQHHIAASIWKP